MKIKLPPGLWILITVITVILLGLADWVTGYELSFSVFYFIPVSIAAWFIGRNAALGVSALCVVAWAMADKLSGHVHPSVFNFCWDVMIRLASFIIIGLAMSKIRQVLNDQFRLSGELKRSVQELQKASSEIKTLSGLLPICASCKRIRDDKGYWNQIEAYIAHHSEAEFSHGICPDCVKKLYPDEYEEMRRDNKL